MWGANAKVNKYSKYYKDIKKLCKGVKLPRK